MEDKTGIEFSKYCKTCMRVTKHIRKDNKDKCLTCEIET